mmetsp:Transcript_10453/g.14409  ORF Transcript_10453/g.14409 Transcript_10453/m.14409 type:complete len:192 (+) Transcript_10453:541-1116(+)
MKIILEATSLKMKKFLYPSWLSGLMGPTLSTVMHSPIPHILVPSSIGLGSLITVTSLSLLRKSPDFPSAAASRFRLQMLGPSARLFASVQTRHGSLLKTFLISSVVTLVLIQDGLLLLTARHIMSSGAWAILLWRSITRCLTVFGVECSLALLDLRPLLLRRLRYESFSKASNGILQDKPLPLGYDNLYCC